MDALEHFDTWQLVALAAALGWASGMRLYAVLFIVGARSAFSARRRCRAASRCSRIRSCSRRRDSCASSSSSPTRFPASIRCGTSCTRSFAFPAGAALAASVFGDSAPATMLPRRSSAARSRRQPLHEGRQPRA